MFSGFCRGSCKMSLSGRKSLTIMKFSLLLAAVLLSALAASGQGNNNNDNDSNKDDRAKNASRLDHDVIPSPPRANDPSLQLGVGDLIELTVYDVPELTTKTRIASTGDIYCALIGPT